MGLAQLMGLIQGVSKDFNEDVGCSYRHLKACLAGFASKVGHLRGCWQEDHFLLVCGSVLMTW